MTRCNLGHEKKYRQWVESQASGIEERAVHHQKPKKPAAKWMKIVGLTAAICAAEPGIHIANDMMRYLSREAQVHTQRGADVVFDKVLPEAPYQLNTKKFRVGEGIMTIEGLAELASKSPQVAQIIRETKTPIDLNKTYFETQMRFLNPKYTGTYGEEFTGINPYIPFKK